MVNKAVHWSEVVEVSNDQPKKDQEFSRQIMDFWQANYPQVFQDIADVDMQRSGRKVVFGFDIVNEDERAQMAISKAERSPAVIINRLVEDDGRFFNTPHISVSAENSKKAGYRITGNNYIKRFSVEEMALHELVHAGDPKFYALGEGVFEKQMEAMKDIAKHGIKFNKHLFRNAEKYGIDVEVLRSIDEVFRDKQDSYIDERTLAQYKIESGKVTADKVPFWVANSAKSLLKAIDEHDNSKEDYILGFEEWTVDRVDRVMQEHVDPYRKRLDYMNFVMELEPSEEIPSYIKGTYSDYTPQAIDGYRQDLSKIIALAQKQSVDGITLSDKEMEAVELGLANISGAAGTFENEMKISETLYHVVPTDPAIRGMLTDKEAKKFADDFADIAREASRAIKELDDVEASIGSGTHKKTHQEMRGFSNKLESFYKELGQAYERASPFINDRAVIGSYLKAADLEFEEAAERLKNGYGMEVKETSNPDYVNVGRYLVNTEELAGPKK